MLTLKSKMSYIGGSRPDRAKVAKFSSICTQGFLTEVTTSHHVLVALPHPIRPSLAEIEYLLLLH